PICTSTRRSNTTWARRWAGKPSSCTPASSTATGKINTVSRTARPSRPIRTSPTCWSRCTSDGWGLLRAEQPLLSGQGYRLNDARCNGHQHDNGARHHHRDSPTLVPKIEARSQQHKTQHQKPQHQMQLINRTHLFPHWSSGPRLPDGSIAIHVTDPPSRCQGGPAQPYCNPFIPLSSPARAEGSIAWPLSLREPPA